MNRFAGEECLHYPACLTKAAALDLPSMPCPCRRFLPRDSPPGDEVVALIRLALFLVCPDLHDRLFDPENGEI